MYDKLIKELQANDLDRPEQEWALCTTYPISILPKWNTGNDDDLLPALENHPVDPPQIYVHIPFCTNKCTYCRYCSDTYADAAMIARYLLALKDDTLILKSKLELKSKAAGFYFGGGTPSILSTEQLHDLFQFYSDHFMLPEKAGWTVETSPETIDAAKLKLFKDAGVNRISIGVQTLDEAVLHYINRAHTAEQAIMAIESIIRFDFAAVNADLIYNLPGQTLASWEQTLDEMIRLNVPELSLYHLRIYPSVELQNYKIDRSKGLAFIQSASERLHQAHYNQVRPFQWIHADYTKNKKQQLAKNPLQHKSWMLGFGASSISRINDYHFFKPSDLQTYFSQIEQNQIPIEGQYILNEFDKIACLLITRFGKQMHVNINCLNTFSNDLLYPFTVQLDKLIDLGLMQSEGDKIMLSPKGLLVYDYILTSFYPERLLR